MCGKARGARDALAGGHAYKLVNYLSPPFFYYPFPAATAASTSRCWSSGDPASTPPAFDPAWAMRDALPGGLDVEAELGGLGPTEATWMAEGREGSVVMTRRSF